MRIKLNVSGKIFETTLETLTESSGYFKTLLTGQFSYSFGENDVQKSEIFIDRPAIGFKHVLSFLQDNQYPFPDEFQYELVYYQISFSKETATEHFENILETWCNRDLPGSRHAETWQSDYEGWSSNCQLMTDQGLKYTSKLQKNDKILTIDNTYCKILEILRTEVEVGKEVFLFQMVDFEQKKRIYIDKYGNLAVNEGGHHQLLTASRSRFGILPTRYPTRYVKKFAFVSACQMIQQTKKSEWHFAQNVLTEKISVPFSRFNNKLFLFNLKLENEKKMVTLFIKHLTFFNETIDSGNTLVTAITC